MALDVRESALEKERALMRAAAVLVGLATDVGFVRKLGDWPHEERGGVDRYEEEVRLHTGGGVRMNMDMHA